MSRRGLAAVLVAAAGLAPGFIEAGPASPGLADLRQGGFVIFIRHAATDPATADRDGPALGACETQGILSDAGRAEARAIGDAFRALGIPAGLVLTSPWCRCVETAQLAFGRGDVDPLLASIHGAVGDEARRAELAAALKTRLARPPSPGTNTVIVGHGFNLAAAARIPLAQGEAALFQPLGEKGFALVSKVGAAEWTRRFGAP